MQQPPEVCIAGGQRVTRHAILREQMEKEKLIRRSTRDPTVSSLDRHDLTVLLTKIRKNHPSTVILKIKDHIHADINSVVFEAILEALAKNRVCQCLYIQNLSKAIGDEQLRQLVELLKTKMIWGLNIGETYEVSLPCWQYFSKKLSETNVTHLYVSEHTIPIELKNEMRFYIRENRKKHDFHCAFKYLHVIERCTNMWWNPINGVKELKPPPPPKPEESESESEEEEEAPPPIVLTPFHTAYWQEGVGEGGEKPWKFKCVCGETCSSYENFRYHPTGRMYECSNPACCLWSHVHCVLGNISDQELAKRKDLLCGTCKSKSRRLTKYLGVDVITLNAPVAAATTTAEKGKKGGGSGSASSLEDDGKPWKFKCKCGEVCSSYEKSIYHPAGQWYECSQCSVWSHVLCNLGNVSPSQIEEMKEVLCFSCATAARRSRKRGAVENPVDAPTCKITSVDAPTEKNVPHETSADDSAVLSTGALASVHVVNTTTSENSISEASQVTASTPAGKAVVSRNGKSNKDAKASFASFPISSESSSGADSDCYFHVSPVHTHVHSGNVVPDDHICTLHDNVSNRPLLPLHTQNFADVAKFSIPTKPLPLTVAEQVKVPGPAESPK